MSREATLLAEIAASIDANDTRRMFKLARELADLIGWPEADEQIERLLREWKTQLLRQKPVSTHEE